MTKDEFGNLLIDECAEICFRLANENVEKNGAYDCAIKILETIK